ncbi:MAG TPA: formyltransferase family protein [Pyrinomonadaceae bacterium]|jgi:folate-dependent phosphoribosylglycinamide formyltransferase PurN|nr:formyltransferase family protein [Pyrinomonadaceae bacterium]
MTDRREPLRVILLTHGGAEEVLARLSFPEVKVVGVFVETDIVRHYGLSEKIKRSIRYDGYGATASKFLKKLTSSKHDYDLGAVLESRNELEQIARERQIPFHLVANYHNPESIELMTACNADLGVIYGTNIIKESVFKIPRLGSINLHQGLAPYYRGGPPIFWELYNGETEVGLTVHFVASKVDTGDIILQETVPLKYDDAYGTNYEGFIETFSKQLRPRCAELVAEAVRLIALGAAETRPQDTTLGARYRLPVKAQKDELRRRLKERQKKAKGALEASRA